MIDGAFQIGLENAAIVALLAPLAWAVSRAARRPALAHAIWLVLLVKLVAPPVYRPGIPAPWRERGADATVTSPETLVPSIPRVTFLFTPAADDGPLASVPIVPRETDIAKAPVAASVPLARWAVLILEMVWAAGSVLCLLVGLARIVRFSRGLRHAEVAAGEVQGRARYLAGRLRLRRVPVVYFIPAPLCPMLWAIGGPARLLVPRALWEGLCAAERDSILLHELAHYRRRDHWVRWVEMAATALFWWNPVCWWVRRELREAEEQCCDAWVLHATGDFRPYANALLHAVEFVSGRGRCGSSIRSGPLPALASGMGQFNHLKRRIVMLKSASVARALSPRALMAAVGFSAVLLPLSPSLKGADEKPVVVEVKAAPTTGAPTQTIVGKVFALAEDVKPVTLDIIEDDQASAEDQLKAARKEIAELRQKLAVAEAQIGLYKAKGEGQKAGAVWSRNNKEQLDGKGENHWLETKVHDDPNLITGSFLRDGKDRVVITDPDSGRIIEMREAVQATEAQQAERLDKLENQLQSILKEIHDIRQQSKKETRDVQLRK